MKKILLLIFSLVFSFQLTANQGERLIEFIKQGNTIEVQNILAFDSANVNYKDREGKTPLIYAVIKENILVVPFLIEKGAAINAQDNSGHTALHVAAILGDKDMVKFLLKNGANPLVKTKIGLASQFASAKRFLEIYLILKKAEKKQPKKDEIYISEVLKHLKDKNKANEITDRIELNFKNNILNKALVALMIVLDKKDINKAKEIIEVVKYYDGFKSALNSLLNYYAYNTRYIGVIDFLLKNGADINSGDSRGNTPLHNASKNVNVYVVQFLLEKGAKADSLNNYENAPIHLLANEYYNVTNDNVDEVIQIIAAIREKDAHILKSGDYLYAPPYTLALFNTEGNVIKNKLSRENQNRVIAAFD